MSRLFPGMPRQAHKGKAPPHEQCLLPAEREPQWRERIGLPDINAEKPRSLSNPL